MTDPIALTVRKSVEVSNLSRTYIYEALKRGDLKARKAGRRTLIEFDSLKQLMASLPQYRTEA